MMEVQIGRNKTALGAPSEYFCEQNYVSIAVEKYQRQ